MVYITTQRVCRQQKLSKSKHIISLYPQYSSHLLYSLRVKWEASFNYPSSKLKAFLNELKLVKMFESLHLGSSLYLWSNGIYFTFIILPWCYIHLISSHDNSTTIRSLEFLPPFAMPLLQFFHTADLKTAELVSLASNSNHLYGIYIFPLPAELSF